MKCCRVRRGELLGLRWEDVDLEAGVVSVNRSTTQIANERVTTLPKNHERRRINIDPQTVATLKTWKREQSEERVAIGPVWADTEGHLFTWQDGRPLQPDYVSKRLQSARPALDSPG